MEIKEWTTIDRKDWHAGPWDSEPDKVQWPDITTGLPCLAVRHRSSGHWCGYVGVAVGHIAHGKHEDSIRIVDDESQYIDIHGGLTFSGACREMTSEGVGICHIPAPGESDDVWWFGFDCAHSGDCSPMDTINMRDGSYRTIAYVKAECKRLAAQLVGPLTLR